VKKYLTPSKIILRTNDRKMAKSHRKSKSIKRTHRKSKAHRKSQRKHRGGASRKNIISRAYAPFHHALMLADNITGQVAKTGKDAVDTTVNAGRKLIGTAVRGVDGVLGSTVKHTKGAVQNTFFRKSRKNMRKSRKAQRKH
jgi:hypothetical protein